MNRKYRKKLRKYWWLLPALVAIVAYTSCLPRPLFSDPYSTVLESREGQLLSAKIARDEQWRFPMPDSLPEKFVKCITYFEDEYFFYHPGVNPGSLLRALYQNISEGRVVSGASTLSMQTIRLARKDQRRTIAEKLKEMLLATRLEFRYSKEEILQLYAAHAPFGGNVVGLEAASWRYYGRKPHQLSWGEMATLAVLPNAPALIYPGRNQTALLRKRNHLLEKLRDNQILDSTTCALAREEPLPQKPHDIPQQAQHLLMRAAKEGYDGKRIKSSLDATLQKRINSLVASYHGVLRSNEIHNLAALVIDLDSATVQAYVGNSDCPQQSSGRSVDIITSPRSTGSLLKPLLYHHMINDGELLPTQLIPDIPTQFSGYAPQNFDKNFRGAVAANEALARSLNIPAARMLKDYGVERFYHKLRRADLPNINRGAADYGLSLILGSAEATMWNLAHQYLHMGQIMRGLPVEKARYSGAQQRQATSVGYQKDALWWTFEAMASLNRPAQEYGWEEFQSSQKIAWKTGTSFGHRDAWAIGLTPNNLVAVWVGNADGEGRPGLTGTAVAAPLMFKIFKQLPATGWFRKPREELEELAICARSGFLPSPFCDSLQKVQYPPQARRGETCPYHRKVHLNAQGTRRVTGSCYSVRKMQHQNWFVLPPVQEWYFKKSNPFYRELPPYQPECKPELSSDMAVIYPPERTRLFVPKMLGGERGKAVFEIAHRQSDSKIHWHLDREYLATTKGHHQLELAPAAGWHRMTLVDQNGERLSWRFEVIEK